MQQDITVSTFYWFNPLVEPRSLKLPILEQMQALGIRGTITLAREGINATISGAEDALRAMFAELNRLIGMPQDIQRESYAGAQPFKRTKVKVKPELISLGVEANPSVCVGQYVAPQDWNALITAPDVITIDTRNDYEFELGHFKGAINPGTRNFKQMVAFTEKNLSPSANTRVAMYCTGGIRCEKYSAYLIAQGFAEVYHLKGGILAYLEQMPPEQSLWEGSCFVFDERVALGHGLVQIA